MNLTSKQRAFLKSKAMTIEATYHVGKNSITPELTASLEDALKARELIKVSVLKNCMDDPAAVAQTVAERTRSTLVSFSTKPLRRPIILRSTPVSAQSSESMFLK